LRTKKQRYFLEGIKHKVDIFKDIKKIQMNNFTLSHELDPPSYKHLS